MTTRFGPGAREEAVIMAGGIDAGGHGHSRDD